MELVDFSPFDHMRRIVPQMTQLLEMYKSAVGVKDE
jgi:hypothetical protein